MDHCLMFTTSKSKKLNSFPVLESYRMITLQSVFMLTLSGITGKTHLSDLFVMGNAKREWYVTYDQGSHMIVKCYAKRLRAVLMQTREQDGEHGSTMV